MKYFCQVMALILLVLGVLISIKSAVEGSPAVKPKGSFDVIVAVIVGVMLFLVHCKAGAFSLLLGGD